MKITVSCECDSVEQAKVILERLTTPGKFTVGGIPLKIDGPPQEVPRSADAPQESTGERIVGDARPLLLERPNVSPGEPSIGKIGAEAKQSVLYALGSLIQPGKKYAEHCKLLWQRGEIKFDGKEYYL